MSEKTTNKLYYFARRKDTGMAGVWFTHCASKRQQSEIARQLLNLYQHSNNCRLNIPRALDVKFPVPFLQQHFKVFTQHYARGTMTSDILLAILRDEGLEIKQMP